MVFLAVVFLAVLLQALQSFSRFANKVSVSYFAAECKALVTTRIHSQVLRLSFPCASSCKVGDLTDYASQGGRRRSASRSSRAASCWCCCCSAAPTWRC